MLELYGTSDSFKPILDIELDPEETRTQKGANADRAISTLSGRRNRVQIGAADPVLIADNWSKNEQLDDEIRSLLDRYDVYSARFAFSFLADCIGYFPSANYANEEGQKNIWSYTKVKAQFFRT
jgi:hypothetical protein